MSFNILDDYDLGSTLDKVEKVKISSKHAKYLDSLPSPFCDAFEKRLDGIVGRWDSTPIEVDDTIEGDIEIVWKENGNA